MSDSGSFEHDRKRIGRTEFKEGEVVPPGIRQNILNDRIRHAAGNNTQGIVFMRSEIVAVNGLQAIKVS